MPIHVDASDLDRGMRVCSRCGGNQYDWGAGLCSGRRSGWFIRWRCADCDATDHQYLSSPQLMALRATPARLGFA
jgi:hypothetical protein